MTTTVQEKTTTGVMEELQKKLSVTQEPKEDRQSYLRRVALMGNTCTEEVWESLSSAAMDWVDECVRLISVEGKDGKPTLPDFPGVTAEAASASPPETTPSEESDVEEGSSKKSRKKKVKEIRKILKVEKEPEGKAPKKPRKPKPMRPKGLLGKKLKPWEAMLVAVHEAPNAPLEKIQARLLARDLVVTEFTAKILHAQAVTTWALVKAIQEGKTTT